jgi:glutamate synthase domain-containing protein 1
MGFEIIMPRIRRELYNKEICACSIFGAMNRDGERFSAAGVMKAIANMRVRGNGLGGGFAAYGIYPKFQDYYAFHLMFTGKSPAAKLDAKRELEAFLSSRFDVVSDEEIPTDDAVKLRDPPMVWRYFVLPKEGGDDSGLVRSEEDYIVDQIMAVNTGIDNAYVFSSGKNMGCFKGVGYPEEVGEYFMLDRMYRPRQISHQHPGLVGRGPSLQPPGHLCRPQRRGLLLRHQPLVPGDARLRLHPPDGH